MSTKASDISVPTVGIESSNRDCASRSPLPPYTALAGTATIAVLVAVAIALIVGKPVFAFGLVGGLAISLLMYAGIYSFTTGATKAISGMIAGKSNVTASQLMPGFLLATVGKFIVIAIALAVMVKFMHINLPMMVVGFLIAQVAITVKCVASLNAVPLLGNRK